MGRVFRPWGGFYDQTAGSRCCDRRGRGESLESLVEPAAGRKAVNANVKKRTRTRSSEQRLSPSSASSRHTSKFGNLLAAPDTMRIETEDAAAMQQRCADSRTPAAMLRQPNNQKKASTRCGLKCSAPSSGRISGISRAAQCERLVEQRAQAAHSVTMAAESQSRIERERAVNEQRSTDCVACGQNTEFKNGVMAERSKMQLQRLEKASRRMCLQLFIRGARPGWPRQRRAG